MVVEVGILRRVHWLIHLWILLLLLSCAFRHGGVDADLLLLWLYGMRLLWVFLDAGFGWV